MLANRAAAPRSRLSYSREQQPWVRIALQPSHTAYCHAVSSCVPAAMTGLQSSHTPCCHAVRSCVHEAMSGLQQSFAPYCLQSIAAFLQP